MLFGSRLPTRFNASISPWGTVKTAHFMLVRSLGKTGISVSAIGYGAVKIGRNQQTKYGNFKIPDDKDVKNLLHGLLDLGINLIDTAPAYGLSESRIGNTLKGHRRRLVLSTKVGETFINGNSHHDFSSTAIEQSVVTSLKLLKTDHLDIVSIHSNGQDQHILEQTDAVKTLEKIRKKGWARAIGFSGYRLESELSCLDWADIMMIEYHPENTIREKLIDRAAAAGVGVLVKKGLDSGRIAPDVGIAHALAKQEVSSIIIGSLNFRHLTENCALAARLEPTDLS